MEEIVRSINNSNKENQNLDRNGQTLDLDDCKYTINIEWLNNKKFIKQLEKDNIDVELLREELTRQHRKKRHYTWREKTLQLIKGNFVQVLLSLLILIDAGIVISEIILEIHSMKSKNEFYEDQNFILKNFILSTLNFYLNSSSDWTPGYVNKKNLVKIINNMSRSSSKYSIRPMCNTSFHYDKISLNTNHHANNNNKNYESNSEDSHKDYYSLDHGTNSELSIIKSKVLHNVGLYLHYISIGVLVVFMVELILRILCIGERFFKKKVEMFDGTIIVTSFVADLIFVQVESEQISVMVIFLLWRIVRLINGLMMHEKQRDEFRITLQKKTRRLCQMKVDRLSTEKELLTKHVLTLEELCKDLGANEEQVKNCKPRFKRYSKEQTNNALKSIAALTTGFMGGMIGAPSSNQSAINRFSGTSPSPSVQSPTSSKKLKIMRKISETPYSSFENSELELTPMTGHTLFLPSSESPLNSVDRESPFKFMSRNRNRQNGQKLSNSLMTDSEQEDRDQQTCVEDERLLMASRPEEDTHQLIVIRHDDNLNSTVEHYKAVRRDSNANAHSHGYASSVSHSTSTSEPNENDLEDSRQFPQINLTQADRCRKFREKFRSQDAITPQGNSLDSRPSVDEGVDFNPCCIQNPASTTTAK